MPQRPLPSPPRPLIPSSLLLLLSLSTLACAPPRSFSLSILNRTDDPLTVGVVKDGPPYEPALAGPEEWAINSQLDTLPPWGHVIPPGRTLDSPPVTGAFPSGTVAYLRVYRGQHPNSHLLAISNPSPDRLEITLFPGHNALIIHNDPKKD